MTYYKLTDEYNLNEIVKCEGRNFYTFEFGKEEWVPNYIMDEYMWPEDVLYDQYIEVSEEEAMRQLEAQRNKLNDLLDLAIKVATEAHAGQIDKGGNPYFMHPQEVAASLENIEEKIVAYLHDVVEDTEVTLQDLENLGFTKRIVLSVKRLTKQKDVNYDDYLKEIKRDDNAWRVKIADIKHNMDISRIENPTEKDLARVEKYKKALEFLEN